MWKETQIKQRKAILCHCSYVIKIKKILSIHKTSNCIFFVLDFNLFTEWSSPLCLISCPNVKINVFLYNLGQFLLDKMMFPRMNVYIHYTWTQNSYGNMMQKRAATYKEWSVRNWYTVLTYKHVFYNGQMYFPVVQSRHQPVHGWGHPRPSDNRMGWQNPFGEVACHTGETLTKHRTQHNKTLLPISKKSFWNDLRQDSPWVMKKMVMNHTRVL